MKTAIALVLSLLLALPALARDESLYQVHLPLRDAAGKTIPLSTFEGHPVIVSMFYGTCPAACPLLVERIHAVEAALSEAQRADLRVLLVSFDPARDTPQVLSMLGKAHHVDESRWTLAAASQADARMLAAILDIHYRALPDGAFEHDSKLVLLDAKGQITGRFEAFESTPEEVAAKLRVVTALK